MLDNHGHTRVFRRGQPGIEFKIQRSLTTGTLLKLEGVFRLQQDILQVATHNGAVKFVETFMEELIIEENTSECPPVNDCRIHLIQ